MDPCWSFVFLAGVQASQDFRRTLMVLRRSQLAQRHGLLRSFLSAFRTAIQEFANIYLPEFHISTYTRPPVFAYCLDFFRSSVRGFHTSSSLLIAFLLALEVSSVLVNSTSTIWMISPLDKPECLAA
jgi:hypothetical protein